MGNNFSRLQTSAFLGKDQQFFRLNNLDRTKQKYYDGKRKQHRNNG